MVRLAGFMMLLLICGCDTERLNQLEKQNQEMKAEIDKRNVAQDYDLQSKCSKDARAFFNANSERDKDTILLDFSNHYNKKLNKCFILGENHFNSHLADAGGTSWTNSMIMFDVYENSKYAEFIENHSTYLKPTIHVGQEVISCNVAGAKCKTQDEFNNLVQPYMNN
jgi:hypothetical protein